MNTFGAWLLSLPRGTGHYILGFLLLVIFLVTIIFAFLASKHPSQWTGTKELLQIILPIETGFLGSVIGYFYGKG